MTPIVYVVTLNWNRPDDTLACLASLRGQQGAFDLRLIVVDNGSTDDSVERIHAAFSAADLLEAGRNLGFGGGMNLGINYALERGAEYILLLNNDTLADSGLVEQLLCHVAPGVGMIAPAIFYAKAPKRIWSVGGGFSTVLLEATGNHGRGRPLPTESMERGFLAACALLVPRQVFERVGLFDERFFMYYEDLDFCLRVRQAGYRLLIAPQARLWHKVAVSSGGESSPAERYRMALSSVLYFRKHARGWRCGAIALFRFGSALKTTLRLLLRGEWAAACAYWRGLRDGLSAR